MLLNIIVTGATVKIDHEPSPAYKSFLVYETKINLGGTIASSHSYAKESLMTSHYFIN